MVIVYVLETDGEKFLIWCSEGSWEVTLEPNARGLRCKGDGVDTYVYPAPGAGSTVVVDNCIDRREFVFVDGVLTPRLRDIETE